MAARTKTSTSRAADVAPATRNLRSGGVRGMAANFFGSLFGGSFGGSGKTYYESASTSAQAGGRPKHVGPNGANGEIAISRDRSRQTYVNNAWYRKLLNSVADNVVDYGMTPIIPYPDLKELWDVWVMEADARGETSFYGLQWVSVLTCGRDGELLVRFRDREDDDMLSGVPFQLQLMEADHLPLDWTKKNEKTGNWIVSGVERNAIDRVHGYWLYPFHPSDWVGTGKHSLIPDFVPARYIVHLRMPGERIGGNRGMPWADSALHPIEGLRGYNHNERVRKKNQSGIAVVYEKPIDEEEGYKGADYGPEGPNFDVVEAGTAVEAPEGYKANFTAPAPVDSNYDSFQRWNLAEAAVSVGFSVELATMNFKDLSDRTARVMLNEIGRRVGVIQFHLLGQLNEKVYAEFVRRAILAGRWTPPSGAKPQDYLRVRWMPPPRGHIHPVQEVNAYKEAVKAGFKSRSEVAAEYGEDVVKIDMENAADQARARDLKLSYSVYPEVNGESPPLPTTPNSAAVDAMAEQDNAESVAKLGTAQAG